jgi:hypothetical protein
LVVLLIRIATTFLPYSSELLLDSIVWAAETNSMIAWRDERHLTATFVATLSAAFSRQMPGGSGSER